MSFSTKLQRTQSTVDLYEKIYRQLENQIRRKEGIDVALDINPARVAMHFNEREGGWEVRTARLYRASLMYVLTTRQTSGDEQATNAIELLTHVHDGEEDRIARKDDLRRQRVALRKKAPRGPRQKVKRFSHQDADTLIRAMEEMRSPHGKFAAAWFTSTTLTGLRPSEWELAKFDTDPRNLRTLVVQNAKNTNGRAHGLTRTLVLSGCTPFQEKVIATHMENVREHAGEFENFYTNCRRTIQRAADKLWGVGSGNKRDKHPTLYTARHMFSADAKSVFDKVSVAAMMGHASIDTAGENYAPAWSSTGSVGVEPLAEDVRAVTTLNQVKIDAEMNKSAGPRTSGMQSIADALPKPAPKSSGGQGGRGGKAGV